MGKRFSQTEYHKTRELAAGGDVHTNPSGAQKDYGNYKKGHAVIHGMRVSIETPAGGARTGIDHEGKKWKQKLRHDYGYIRGTTGKDKDHIDTFLGPDCDDPDCPVHVVDQNKKGSDDFDEHKVMMGFRDPDDAAIAYHMNYEPGWGGFRGITSMPVSQFKDWAYSGKSGKRKPAADYVAFNDAVDSQTNAGYGAGGPVKSLGGRLAEKRMKENGYAGGGLIRNAMKDTAELLGKSGKGARTAEDVPRALRGTSVIKDPGGNFMGSGIKRVIDDLITDPAGSNPVDRWVKQKIPRHIKNQLGTKNDPVVPIMNEGKGHLGPDYLDKTAKQVGYLTHDGQLRPVDSMVHQEATGRDTATPYEVLSDRALVNRGSAGSLLNTYAARGLSMKNLKPAWLSAEQHGGGQLTDLVEVPYDLRKAARNDPTAPVWDVEPDKFGGLGFESLPHYLNDAVMANYHLNDFGGNPAEMRARANKGQTNGYEADEIHDAADMVEHNLHIDPSKLDMMSVPDVVRKAGEYGDRIGKIKEMRELNKGIKSVVKQYPDSGYQWVELNEHGAQPEGKAMGHCVGDYCDAIAAGTTRILSLRDKNMQPHATVDLRKELDVSPEGLDALPRHMQDEAWRLAEEQARAEGYTPDNDDEWADAIGEMHIEQAEKQIELYNEELRSDPDAPWNIMQIKGRGTPDSPKGQGIIDKYHPFVQDLVRNMGPWGPDVQDLQNTGLKKYGSRLHTPDEFKDLAIKHGKLDMSGRGLEDYPTYLAAEEAERKAQADPVPLWRDKYEEMRAGREPVFRQMFSEALERSLQNPVRPDYPHEFNVPDDLPATPDRGFAGGGAVRNAMKDAAQLLGRSGRGLRTSEDIPRALQGTSVIKDPGGNFMGTGIDQVLDDLTHGHQKDDPVARWVRQKVPRHIKNQMGTKDDPLARVMNEGAGHMSPTDQAERAYGAGTTDADGNYKPVSSEFHKSRTGRDTATPYEVLSDSPLVSGGAARDVLGHMAGRAKWISNPPWLPKGQFAGPLTNLDAVPREVRMAAKNSPDADIWDVNPDSFRENMGFDHLRDYLDAATKAGRASKEMPNMDELRAWANGGTGEQQNIPRMVERNLHIDPDKLGMMSIPDVSRLVPGWDDLLSKTRAMADTNKGVKSVLKQYPDTGHQWVELNPEGLGGEGDAMGHCVGGYCSRVENGQSRVLSLRDKDAQPHITVELRQPETHRIRNKLANDWLTENEHSQGFQDWEGARAPNHNQSIFEMVNSHLADTGQPLLEVPGSLPWDIMQIKGRGTPKNPKGQGIVDRYHPFAQDLVKNMGPWGPDVADLKNTGLVRHQGGMTNIYDGPEKYRNITMPEEGHYTPAEVAEHFMSQGVPEPVARQHAGDYPGLLEYIRANPDQYQNIPGIGGGEGFAEGGSVPDDDSGPQVSRVTPAMMDDAEANLAALRPAFRSPMMLKRREDRQDRTGAKEVPLALARGLLTGTLGFGGDMEGWGRSAINIVPKIARAKSFGGFLDDAISSDNDTVDATAALPTSDFYRDVLPLKSQSKTGQAAETVASMLANPLSGAVLKGVRGLSRTAPIITRALEASRAARPGGFSWPRMPDDMEVGFAGGGMVRNMMKNTAELLGKSGKVSRTAADAKDIHGLFAVKEPGGNWSPETAANIDRVLGDRLGYTADHVNPANKWMHKRLSKHIQRDMGTANDPFLAQERKGRFLPGQANLSEEAMAGKEVARMGPDGGWMNAAGESTSVGDRRLGIMKPGFEGLPTFEGDRLHRQLTGRDYRTALENATDNMVHRKPLADYSEGVPPWIQKLKDEDPNGFLNHFKGDSVTAHDFVALDFDLLKRHINQATQAHYNLDTYGGDINEFRKTAGQSSSRDAQIKMAERGHHLDPDKLDAVTLPQMLDKYFTWQDFVKAEAEKSAIKGTLKEYPEGYKWVDLNAEGLPYEGDVMQHCVGQDCQRYQKAVSEGTSRILSLRDAGNNPHATVELNKPQTLDWKQMRRNQYNWDNPHYPWYRQAKQEVMADPDHMKLSHDDLWNKLDDTAERIYKEGLDKPQPWDIGQIKGKQNKAPIDQYQPYVQDLVRNMGPWGQDIGDFENTGLRYLQGFIKGTGKGHKVYDNTGRNVIGEIPVGMHSKPEIRKQLEDFGYTGEDIDQYVNNIFDNGEVKYVPGNDPGYAGGGAVRKALTEELPGMATRIRNLIAEARRNKVEMSLIGDAAGTDRRRAMITGGDEESVDPRWAAKIASGPNYGAGHVLDFHTHPSGPQHGVTPSQADLEFSSSQYPMKYGVKQLTTGIGQPPHDPWTPGQLNLFRTDNPREAFNPAKVNDAVNELKWQGRGGKAAEHLYGDMAGEYETDMGDLIGNMGPLMLQDWYGKTGRGSSRLLLPRQVEDGGMSGNEVMDIMGPFYSDVFKRKGYATGGAVIGDQTVGLGQFGNGQSQQGASAGPLSNGWGFGGNQQATSNTGAFNAMVPAQTPTAATYNPYGIGSVSASGVESGRWADAYGGLSLNGALPGADPNSKAPIYDINPEAGGLMNPMLRATLDSAGQGSMSLPGVQAFLGAGYHPVEMSKQSVFNPDGTITPWRPETSMTYNAEPLSNLARAVGFDTSKYDLNPNNQGEYTPGNGMNGAAGMVGSTSNPMGITQLYKDLNDYTKDYVGIGGLSGGWNPTGDWRGRDSTLYKNVDGKLVPVSDSSHTSAPRTGGWIRQNPLAFQALMAAGAIVSGGLTAGAAAGAGAAASGAAEGAAAGTAAGTTAGTTAGATAAGTGAGATAGGWGGALANAAGYGSQWAALPAWGQGAIQGAVQGGVTSELTGGDPWRGVLTGAAGGAGGAFGGAAAGAYDPALKGFGSTLGSSGSKYAANELYNRS